MWVAQVWGYNRIQFEPKEPCHKMCNTLEDTIEEGEVGKLDLYICKKRQDICFDAYKIQRANRPDVNL